MIARRKLLIALGTGALAAPLVSLAQKLLKIWRIGWLWETEQFPSGQSVGAFTTGLRELGYIEGKDYVLEHRAAQNEPARLSASAAELLALKVNVIVTSGTASAVAARKVTHELPILIANVGDPVASGLATSLRYPGGNVTGLTNINSELYSKRLDLLRQVPGMRRVGMLYNPDNGADALNLKRFESDCVKLQFVSIHAPVRKAEEIAAAFMTLQREKAQGLIVSQVGRNYVALKNIVEQAAKHRLPAIYATGTFVMPGALISYGPNFEDQYRRAAVYADKIFKGAKAGDLPIEQPIKFEMVLNLVTAKALGITIPQAILLQATKVIE